MKSIELKKFNLPTAPGVYFFLKGKKILYIGKATSLKDRVRSYFSNDLISSRGTRIIDMVTLSDKIEFQKTDSVLEALILEASLIKKHQPEYNTLEKDNKSFNFVCITKEKFPRIFVRRGRTVDFEKEEYKDIFGPYTSGTQLKEALKIIRKIFPFYGEKSGSKIYEQIGLEPSTSNNSEYNRNIRHIKLFFQGKKKEILKQLEKAMKEYAKKREFEKANQVKKQIFALGHIRDVSLIKEDSVSVDDNFRIESFDVAHMQGSHSVGVMTVMENGEVKKSDYRKFILRTTKRGDDVGGLEEILTRRLKHSEWKTPDLIVIDGGVGQKNRAERVLIEHDLKIPILNVVKDDKHNPVKIVGKAELVKKYKKDVLLINSEAHRFAISFYRAKHRKGSLLK